MKELTNELAVFDPFQAHLVEFQERYVGVVYDMEDPDKEKQARSDKRAIGSEIAKLDKAHATAKAPWKERCDVIDATRKALKDKFLEVQEAIKIQIVAQEEKVAAHAQELEDKVQAIYDCAVFEDGLEVTFDHLEARLQRLEGLHDHINDSFEDRLDDAQLAFIETEHGLTERICVRGQYEKDQAELKIHREEKEAREKKEAEEKIRKKAVADAVQKSADEATKKREEANKEIREAKEREEQAVRDKEEAETKAIQDKKDAEERAEKEKQEAVEAERKKHEEEKAEEEKKAAKALKEYQEEKRLELEKETKRKSHAWHKQRIENEATESLAVMLIKEDILNEEKVPRAAAEIIDGIIAGEVAHITINY